MKRSAVTVEKFFSWYLSIAIICSIFLLGYSVGSHFGAKAEREKIQETTADK